MAWITRQAGRLDEMSQRKLSLRIEVHQDNDYVLCIEEDGIPIEDQKGNRAQVEFCSTSGGGGRSPHTRAAIANLLEAIILDNRADPTGIPQYPVGLKEAMEKEP